MLLVSKNIQSNTLLRNFKAPKGFQYLIQSILFAIEVAAVNTLILLAESVETTILSPPIGRGIVGISVDSVINFQVTGINHKTKFMSLAFVNTNLSIVRVYIYGELVPITRTEAIWEWFRKGR